MGVQGWFSLACASATLHFLFRSFFCVYCKLNSVITDQKLNSCWSCLLPADVLRVTLLQLACTFSRLPQWEQPRNLPVAQVCFQQRKL